MYGIEEPSHPVAYLPCVVPFACPDRNVPVWPDQNDAIFHPFTTVNGGQWGWTQAWQSRGGAPHRVGGPGATRRAELSGRSSPDGGGYEFKRVVHHTLGSPRPAGSTPGGRHKPLLSLSNANGGTWQPGGSGAWQLGARRLPAWLGFAGEARRTAGWPPPGENYSARRPLRAAPTFPSSRRYRLPPVSEQPDPARPRGAAAAGKEGAEGGGRP